MMRPLVPILLAGGLFLPIAVADLEAVTPRRRQLLDRAVVEQGTARDIAVRNGTGLRLAPRIREIPLQPGEGNPQPFVWCQAADSQGRLFVGTGNEGRVFRVTSAGIIDTWFQAPEIEITALAVDPDDYLFVATAPGGRIYRVSPDGSSVLFFETEERYIWALARTPDGYLYAATGDRGVVYRISPAGTAEAILDSGDPHIVSLAIGTGNRLFAGSAGRGLIYRISEREAEIVAETGADEVSALAVGNDGTLYAGLLEAGGGKAQRRKEEDRLRQRREEGSLPGLIPDILQDDVIGPAPDTGIFDPRDELARRGTIGSRLIAVSPDGWTRDLWKDNREVLYSLAMGDGALFAGTGRTGGTRPDADRNPAPPAPAGDGGAGGALRRLVEPEGETLVARLPQSQVSSLLPRPAGGLFAATSNLGNLYWVENELVDSGTFTAKPVDAGLPAHWGRIWWEGEAPPGSRVEFSTRTGNSERPDPTWSDWVPATSVPDGFRIESSAARFLQWRVELRRPAGGASPELQEVWVSFQQVNAPPVIGGVRVASRIEKKDDKKPAGAPKADSPPTTGGSPADAGGTADPAGDRRIVWDSSDPNGDDLVFTLEYQSAREKNWQPIAADLEAEPFDWDTGGIPDGRYRVRVLGSDRSDNPPDSALTADSVSGFFVIDHTAPAVSVSGSPGDRGSARLAIEVSDNLSGIASMGYSVDGGPWIPVLPDDGICDSGRETAQVALTGLAGGDHSVKVRARDVEGNTGSGSFDFSLKP